MISKQAVSNFRCRLLVSLVFELGITLDLSLDIFEGSKFYFINVYLFMDTLYLNEYENELSKKN